MKKVFISHPYSDNPELRKKQVDYICKNLPDDVLPISPIHLFAFEKDDSRRAGILQVCYELIDLCDEAWIYQYDRMSEGQILEMEYALYNPKRVKYMTPSIECIRMGKEDESDD